MNIKYPKKSLGQNFLNDKNIIDIIVNSGDIKKNDTILEVGPGTGNLTEKIISSLVSFRKFLFLHTFMFSLVLN